MVGGEADNVGWDRSPLGHEEHIEGVARCD